MKHKTWLMALALALALLVGSLGTTQAQSGEDFIWQYWLPQNVTAADDLKALLTQEVRDTIAAGHLAPFRVLYGELTTHYFWYQRFDVVYTLSLAYPYLPTDVQAQVKTYLKNEMSQYPLWSGDLLDAGTGTRREADLLTAGEIGKISAGYSRRPKLFSLYALWLYAQQTGDWAYIEQNWNAITSFYNTNRSEVNQYYQSIAGAIGLARMAKQKPTPDTKMQSTAITDITNGLNAGKNFTQFGKNATTTYRWEENGWDWTYAHIFEGFQFLNLTPEIARFINANSALKTAVLGGSYTELYSLKRGEYMYPLWYVAQGNSFNRYFGEGSGNPPDAKAMIFPLKAWVQKENATALRLYVDVPDAMVGDFYYLQGLAYAIQAHGKECWEDLRTATGECGATSPTPNPLTLTPTNTAVPPTTAPTNTPTLTPTSTPTITVTATPTQTPTKVPTLVPTGIPTKIPTIAPTGIPTSLPTSVPTRIPTGVPTTIPPTTAPNFTPTPVLNKPGVIIAVNPANTQPGQPVPVQVGVVNVTNLYGLQLVCQVDPAILTGTGFTGGDGFNPNNSFFVDQGYQLASGSWSIAASRLRPAPAITGNLLAFTLNYQLKAAGNTAVTCTAKGVDEEGWTIDLTIINGTYNNLPPTLVPTLIPTSTPILPTPVPPTPIPNKMSEITGSVQYPGRTDHSNIQVILLMQNTPLAAVVTASDGSYRFTDVPLGTYELALSAPYSLVIHQPINVASDGQVIDQGATILPMGDTDNNGKVDLIDAAFVGANFEVESSLVPNADFNIDQMVNIQDLVEVGKNFGLTSPLEPTTP